MVEDSLLDDRCRSAIAVSAFCWLLAFAGVPNLIIIITIIIIIIIIII